MKPVRLSIEGVNSFTDEQVLDFEQVGRGSLFCISGKTGAGKSTIFDSIMLALYGRSAKGNLADAVNLSRTSARVVLDFTAGGELYTVERVIKCRNEKNASGAPTGRRIGSSECTLSRGGEHVAQGDEATARIAELIGLDESEFKNVYLLEQGEYSDFLKKQPAKQLETVGKIFELMRFADINKRAGEKQRDAEAEAAATEQRIADLGELPPDAVRHAKSELSALKAKSTAISAEAQRIRTELEALEKTRDAYMTALEKQKTRAEQYARYEQAKARLDSAETELKAFDAAEDDGKTAELEGLRERLNGLSALGAIDREYAAQKADAAQKRINRDKKRAEADSLEAGIKNSERALAEKTDALKSALAGFKACAESSGADSDGLSRALAALCGETPDTAALSSAYFELCAEKSNYDALKAVHSKVCDSLSAAEKQAEETLKKIEMYASAIAEAKAAEESAAAAEKKADEELTAARIASYAHAVRAELRDGDTCPVCGGTYHGGQCEGDDVQTKKAGHERAVQAHKRCAEKLAELEKLSYKAKNDYDRADAERRRLAGERDAAEERIKLTGVSDGYADIIKTLAAAKAAGESRDNARAEFDRGAPELARVRAEADAADAALTESEKKAEELAAKLGDMCGRTDAEIASVTRGIETLRAETEAREKKQRELRAECDRARSAVDTVAAMIKALGNEAADIPEFDEDGYRAKRAAADASVKEAAECSAAIERKAEEISALEQKADRLKTLSAERAEQKKRADRYGTIAAMTKGKAMLNFVAAEYIEDFTGTASDILNDLSGGKYNMYYDRQDGFTVSDFLNEGKLRKTDTLSGGEMFLASLAVAIAISQSQGGGDNAFFFLDEGFGTLDDDLIDIVYGALEDLARTRLVGVISHSSSLIDRMSSVVEVIEATDTSGSRIKYQ